MRIWLSVFAACGLAAAADTFEVASIKPSPPVDERAGMTGRVQDMILNSRPAGWLPTDKTRMRLTRRTLAQLIAAAYRVRTEQVSGPSWMSDARWDIEAKLPEGAPVEHVNEMLQALLEERFGLKVHREEAESSGYAMVVAKGGPKLAAADDNPRPPVDMDEMKRKSEAALKARIGEMTANREAGVLMGPSNSWSRPNATMGDVALWLSGVLHKPVVDMTAIEGKYSVRLEVQQVPGEGPEPAAAQAVAKLGLKLESRKVPTVTMVVDRVEKTPTEN